MLDWMAQVPREQMEPGRAFDVGRPANLAQVPRASRLRIGRCEAFRHVHHSVWEVAAEDDEKRPHVADHVGGGVAREYERRGPFGQEREEHVVVFRDARESVSDVAVLPEELVNAWCSSL